MGRASCVYGRMGGVKQRASPKSATFTVLLARSTRMFCGFRSRWMTRRACAKLTAFSIWYMYSCAPQMGWVRPPCTSWLAMFKAFSEQP